MQRTALILATAIALVALPTAAREVAAETLGGGVDEREIGGREPGERCETGHTGYYWTVSQWFTGEESYLIYCEPSRCPACDGSWKPLSATMYLFWEFQNDCGLTVTAEVREATVSVPDHPVPGEVICASAPIVAGPYSPAGLWAVTVDLPNDCPGLTGPFFVSVTFLDECDDPPSLVTDPGPCKPCTSWNDWGLGPTDLCDYDFPGNLSMLVRLECQGPTPVEPATWTTLKAMYRRNRSGGTP